MDCTIERLPGCTDNLHDMSGGLRDASRYQVVNTVKNSNADSSAW